MLITGQTRDYTYENILPPNAICAEIGVDEGLNAERIIKISKPKELYLIDPWDPYVYKHMTDLEAKDYVSILEIRYNNVKDKYKNNKSVKIIRETSISASKNFKDEYFDWVYIDADHDYNSVKEDIEHWYPKVKMGGFIGGHDYIDNNTNNKKPVKRAVDEFIENNYLELYYKGNGKIFADGNTDWAIKKPL